MASLDKTTLAASLKAADLTAKAETNPANFDAAMEAKANAYANAIDTYIKGSLDSATAGGDPVSPGKTVVA